MAAPAHRSLRRPPRRPPPHRAAGFSLLEILVAFSILALALGVLLQIFSGGVRNALAGENYSRAADLAESVLALAGTEIPLAPGGQAGETQGLHWELAIAPYTPPDLLAPPEGVVAYLVTARVSWTELGRRHGLELNSLRLGQEPR